MSSPAPRTERGSRQGQKLDHQTLPHPVQRAIVKSLAEFNSLTETQRLIAEQYHISLTHAAMYHYRTSPRWFDQFHRDRAEFLARVAESPLAHDRVRLDRLETLYQRAEQEAVRTLEGRRATRREQRELLGEAREEMHRTNPVMQMNILAIQYNHMTNEELQRRRDELLATLRRLPDGTPEPQPVLAADQRS